MEKRKALVTGASSGFGLLTVLELAQAGWQVVAAMRNTAKSGILMERARELHVETNLIIHELDVTSEASINTLPALLDDLGGLDILVNNAGYAAGGFVEEIPIDEYRNQFETNVFGVIAVTKTVLPYMRKQGSGKIINISSISGLVGFPGLSPYVSSKYALEGWSESLRLELKPFGVDVILIEPGSYQTNIWSSGKQVTKSEESSPYFKSMQQLEHYIQSGEDNYGDPREVAILITKIAAARQPKLRYAVGKGVSSTAFIKNLLPWKRWETIVLKLLSSKK